MAEFAAMARRDYGIKKKLNARAILKPMP